MERALSLVVAAGYLVLVYIGGGFSPALLMVLAFLTLPLACIWFGEEMGSFLGLVSLIQMTSQSPGCLVRFMGWILLFFPVIVILIAKMLGFEPQTDGRW